MTDNTVIHISGTEQFEQEVLKSDQPVLVDFFAEWCGPCKLAAPIMDKLSSEYAGKAKVAKIDVDEEANRELSMKYGVMSIPTVFAFKGGEQIDKNIGFIGEDGYRKMIEKGLDE